MQVNAAKKVAKMTLFRQEKVTKYRKLPAAETSWVLYKKTLLPYLGGEGGPILVMPSDYK